jgi:hypothetical protein
VVQVVVREVVVVRQTMAPWPDVLAVPRLVRRRPGVEGGAVLVGLGVRTAGVEQNDIVGVVGILVGEVERAPDAGIASR